jgi:PEP-CTERM motif
MTSRRLAASIAILGSLHIANALAVPVYLNDTNISVAVGSGTSAGTFNNTFSGGSTIGKVIDAPSATAEEFHNQATHIWFTASVVGGGLELVFDFGIDYDISTLHFWNYTSEDFDVDNVAFTFFDATNSIVGSLPISPALGSSPGITAQDITLAAPLNVRFVTAFLTGSNGEVDFQNIGFTAEVSTPVTPTVPEPGTLSLVALAMLGALRFRATRKARNHG